MRFCFVTVREHNHFMTELLSMISAATAAAGHDVELAFDAFPALDDDGVYLAIPHELHGHLDAGWWPTADQCARTVALCTENPGTEWFEATCHLLPHFGAAVAFNRASVDELRRRGIPCEHLQLGYSPLWDHWGRDEQATRPLEVLYLGAQDARRDPILASYGRHLWSRQCQFLVPALESRGAPGPDYLTGAQKYERLRAAQLVLNLHRAESASLEWVRFLESACNGCVMVSEPCADHQPLRPGEHFIAASAESLPLVADRLLDDPDRLQRVRLSAYDYVRDELPMAPGVERLAMLAETTLSSALAKPPASTSAPASSPLPPRPVAAPAPTPALTQDLGVAVRALAIETQELRRAVADVAHRVRTGKAPELEIRASTPAYAEAVPRVTVIITLHDYEREVVEALASVAVSEYPAFDVLILDDASTDGSLPAAAGFMAQHPWLPVRLLSQPVNRGLAHSRNTLLEHARGEYVFVLDADNGVYPTALARLAAALDADRQASFAYSMIAAFQDGSPLRLLSGLPWDPGRLRQGNYIDAMALVRREHILGLDGYATDPRITGWEDFHLWCRCAEAGLYGVMVPQVLAWYRRRAHAMLADTESSTVRAWSLMRTRFPDLLGRQPPGVASGPA
ncbi:MAG TPA: glycosyltransferase [Solirubrobacteraceae bacterium]|nr:glycosyltransferase [Solirubrobacteraceae bacterium]